MGTIINYPRKIDKNQKCFRKLISLQLMKINEKKKEVFQTIYEQCSPSSPPTNPYNGLCFVMFLPFSVSQQIIEKSNRTILAIHLPISFQIMQSAYFFLKMMTFMKGVLCKGFNLSTTAVLYYYVRFQDELERKRKEL